jgi:hypothetical protein
MFSQRMVFSLPEPSLLPYLSGPLRPSFSFRS